MSVLIINPLRGEYINPAAPEFGITHSLLTSQSGSLSIALLALTMDQVPTNLMRIAGWYRREQKNEEFEVRPFEQIIDETERFSKHMASAYVQRTFGPRHLTNWAGHPVVTMSQDGPAEKFMEHVPLAYRITVIAKELEEILASTRKAERVATVIGDPEVKRTDEYLLSAITVKMTLHAVAIDTFEDITSSLIDTLQHLGMLPNKEQLFADKVTSLMKQFLVSDLGLQTSSPTEPVIRLDWMWVNLFLDFIVERSNKREVVACCQWAKSQALAPWQTLAIEMIESKLPSVDRIKARSEWVLDIQQKLHAKVRAAGERHRMLPPLDYIQAAIELHERHMRGDQPHTIMTLSQQIEAVGTGVDIESGRNERVLNLDDTLKQ